MASEQSKEGYNLCHRLAESGCYKAWNFLLSCLTEKEKGTLLSAEGKNKNNCVIIACKEQTTTGHVKVLKSILSEKYFKHCDINGGGEYEFGALYRASQFNHVAAVKLVLKVPNINLNRLTFVMSPFSFFQSLSPSPRQQRNN